MPENEEFDSNRIIFNAAVDEEGRVFIDSVTHVSSCNTCRQLVLASLLLAVGNFMAATTKAHKEKMEAMAQAMGESSTEVHH